MAKRRSSKKSSKCPEPFNTLLDIAGAATLHAYVKNKVKKDYLRGEGESSAKAATMVFGIGAMRRGSEGIISLGGLMGVNSALKDIEKTEAVRTVIAKEPFVNHVSGVPVNVPTKSVPKYTWRQYCEDGEPYGISPLDFESADEYDAALQSAKSAADESPVIECVKPHKDPQKAKPQEIKNLWRKYCSDGSPFGLNPQDFDSADDYEDAVAEAKRTMGTNQDNQT